ncbi:MAG TPA: hypothetical protein VGN07_05585 [Steroidobacteraceae bacterium]|jgi:hypothetical protein
MNRIIFCIVAQLGLIAHASAAAPVPDEPTYTFTDLTGDYTRFFDRTTQLNADQRVAAFKSDFIPVFPDFYGAARFPQMTAERFDARIAKSFGGFPAIRDRYSATAATFTKMLRPALETFRRAFPDVQALPPVYLLHSLGEMDGGTRKLGGKLVLIFGADVMVTAHDFKDEQPFLHHELFHVYHQHYFPECTQVWCGLWLEGLAVYVAQQLNPQSSDSQLLLMQPEPIRAQVDAHLQDAICAARARLSSSDDADMDALFSFKRLNADVPPRAGYYIGYLAAKQAGKTRSLSELAHLSQAEARPVLERALAQIAKCQ